MRSDSGRMMLLLFTVGEHRFGLDVSRIVEVIPYIALKKIPRAPDGVAGLFNFRGSAVPVIDVSMFISGTRSPSHLSTRIVLVRYGGEGERVIGLVLQHATETIKVDPSTFVPAAVGADDGEYLGELVMDDKGMIQLIHIDKLLPPRLRALLFGSHTEEEIQAIT